MKAFQFRLAHVMYFLGCIALLAGWTADHYQQQKIIDELETKYFQVSGRLDGLVREFEFHTSMVIEEDEFALWIIDNHKGSRMPITGRVHEAKKSLSH